MAFCTQCGKMIPDQTKYCPYCGSVVEQPKAPEPAQQAHGFTQPGNYTPVGTQPGNYTPAGSQPINNQPPGSYYAAGPSQGPYQPSGQQFQRPEPPAGGNKPKKKSKVPLIILLVVLGLALLGGSIYAGIHFGKNRSDNNASSEEESEGKGPSKGGKEQSSDKEEDSEGSKEENDSKEESSDSSDSSEHSESSSEPEASELTIEMVNDTSLEDSYVIKDATLDIGTFMVNYVMSDQSVTDMEEVSDYTAYIDDERISSTGVLSESQLVSGDHRIRIEWEKDGISLSIEQTVSFTIEASLVITSNAVTGIQSLEDLMIQRTSSPEWDYWSVTFEHKGYPTQWTGNDIYTSGTYQADALAFSVSTSQGTKWGVIDHSGTVLFEPLLSEKPEPILFREDWIGLLPTYDGYTGRIYFTEDFSTLGAETVYGFGFVNFPYCYVVDGTIYLYDGEKTTAKSSIPDILKGSLVPVLKQKTDSIDRSKVDIIGYVYIKSDGSFIEQNAFLYSEFVNGYYVGSKEKGGGKVALIDPKTGKAICDFIYDEARYFEEGYCVVKRDGKYGLINENGEEVVPCAFDSMSSVYNGKAIVIFNGKCAVIDLAKTLKGGAVLTKDAIQTAFNDVTMGNAYEAPDPTQTFMVWIPYNNLYIRTGAGTNYNHLSYFISPGVYEIVEVQSGTGSTSGWGKLANGDGWVALDFCYRL